MSPAASRMNDRFKTHDSFPPVQPRIERGAMRESDGCTGASYAQTQLNRNIIRRDLDGLVTARTTLLLDIRNIMDSITCTIQTPSDTSRLPRAAGGVAV
jgi:hypothetical protein